MVDDARDMERGTQDSTASEALPTVLINGAAYTAHQRDLTGLQLRQLPFPPISADNDLWLERPGEPDTYVQDDEVIHLADNMRIFSAPRSIMPGGAAMIPVRPHPSRVATESVGPS